MSINTLSKNLLDQGQKRINTFEKEVELECKNLEKESNLRINSFKKIELIKQKKELSILTQEILGSAKKEYKNKILNIKSEILSNLKQEFEAKLLNLKLDSRKEFFNHLIININKNFKFNKIICQRKDSKIIKEILTGLNLNEQIKISTNDNILGIELYNGVSEKVDLTYKTILNYLLEENNEKIQKMLFNYY